MSRMLSKMNLISVVQQLPKEDIETIQGYVEMIEDENKELNQKYLNAVADYETTIAEKEQLNSLVNSCQEEIRRLMKQLENANEQISYLRRSIERKEETIIDLEHERVPYENEYVEELKKQLEQYQEEVCILDMITDENIKYKNQQKEFIEYLEDLIKQNETVVEVSKYGLPKNCSKLLIDFYKEILSKFKEIIGGNK